MANARAVEVDTRLHIICKEETSLHQCTEVGDGMIITMEVLPCAVGGVVVTMAVEMTITMATTMMVTVAMTTTVVTIMAGTIITTKTAVCTEREINKLMMN